MSELLILVCLNPYRSPPLIVLYCISQILHFLQMFVAILDQAILMPFSEHHYFLIKVSMLFFTVNRPTV